MNAKQQFIDFITEASKTNGFDELTSKLVGILYAEPKEICLEELSKKVRYSLSAVSTETKNLERFGLVKKIRKPGSRKVYYYMEKDLHAMALEKMRLKYEKVLLKGKEELPKIISEYKKQKGNPEELKIMEEYMKQLLKAEKIFKIMFTMFNKFKKK